MKNFIPFSITVVLSVLLLINIVVADEECPCKKQRDNKLVDQDFGMPLTPDDFLTNMMTPWIVHDYFRPWRHTASLARDLGSTIKTEKDKFQINLDVQHFSPDEISVKTAEGYVVVEAKHEEKQDEHGYVSRQFVRKYSLPEGADTANVVSELSTDGILTVTAPRKVIDDKGERVVPITKTGPVRKESAESKNAKEADQGFCEDGSQKCNNV